MADPYKQKLADALAGMTSGQVPAEPEPDRTAASSSEFASSGPASASAQTGFDDDAAVAPRPDPQKLGRHLVEHTRHESSLRAKRTLIPILLTLGVLLPVMASLKWLSSPESAFAEWSSGLALAMLVAGLVILAAAIANMLSVKHMLAQHPSQH